MRVRVPLIARLMGGARLRYEIGDGMINLTGRYDMDNWLEMALKDADHAVNEVWLRGGSMDEMEHEYDRVMKERS